MTFQEVEGFLAGLRKNLLENFRDEESFGFLEGDGGWQELLRSVE